MKVQTVIDFTHEDIRRMVEQAAREQIPAGQQGTMKVEFSVNGNVHSPGPVGVTAQVSVESMAPRNQAKPRSSRPEVSRSIPIMPEDEEVVQSKARIRSLLTVTPNP